MERRKLLQAAAIAPAAMVVGASAAHGQSAGQASPGATEYFKITTYLPGYDFTEAVYLGNAPQLDRLPPGQGRKLVWTPPPSGENRLDTVGTVRVTTWQGEREIPMTKRAAATIGTQLFQVGYDNNNYLLLFTNGVYTAGPQAAQKLATLGTSAEFANGFVYILTGLQKIAEQRDDSSDWASYGYAILTAWIAIDVIAIAGGPTILGLAVGAAILTFGGSSAANGDSGGQSGGNPSSSFSQMDEVPDFLSNQTVQVTNANGSIWSFIMNWENAFQ